MRQLERLHHNPFLLLIVSDLRVSRQRKVLAQRVAVEAIIGQNTPQIRVVDKEDAEQIVHFALVPVGAIVQARDRGHRSSLVGVRLDADARVVADREHVVNNLEALVASGVVDGGDVGNAGELGGRMVLKKAEGGYDAGGRNIDGEFVLPHRELLNILGQTRHEVLAIGVQAVGLGLVFVCIPRLSCYRFTNASSHSTPASAIDCCMGQTHRQD